MGYSKEQAERVLRDNAGIDGRLKRYFTAIIEGTLPQYYLEEFSHKRDDYSDDLPSVDVRTLIDAQATDRLSKYKCQGNYVVGLALTLRQAMSDGVIDNPKLQRDIQQFLDSDLNFQVGDPFNQRRISSINSILGKTLGHLRKKA